MRHAPCGRCSRSLPLNDLYGVDAETLCEACANQELERRAQAQEPPADVARLTDPTVCSVCQTDHGSMELPLVGGHPLCQGCTERVRNRPFPDWLKKGTVALLLLAALSLWYHRRFAFAFVHVAQANRAFKRGDAATAAAHMGAASVLVPEDSATQAMAAFYRGLLLMQQDHSAEAVKEFQQAKAVFGAGLDRVILLAEGSAAFEAKDYDRFLEKQQAAARLSPDDAMTVGALASAYACKFAVGGDEKHKSEALAHLERARALSAADPRSFKEYEERILHRLQTREIITAEEYHRRFPKAGVKP